MKPIEVGIGFSVFDGNEPTYPKAKHGDAVEGRCPGETDDQRASGLIWYPCLFCGRYILCKEGGREQCPCGAKACRSKGQEGWRRGKDTRWFI